MIAPGETLKPISLLFLFFLCGIPCYNSLPLSTNKRWIVDTKTGQRVKLACVNWPSHLEAMLAEGLNKKPLTYLASQVTQQRFTCVRLTWATYMFTRPHFSKLTVAKSFDSLNLKDAKDGVAKHNPSLLNLTVVEAFQAVVDELGKHGLMVVADNHVSRPTWCCSEHDGNGFIGDVYFDPDEWILGLTTVAKLFKGKSQVIAIGMRNELRGPHQNEDDWYKYISRGAMEIHRTNPDVLVFASGLNYASDLTFLKEKPLGISLGNKLVYEAHWYSWSWGHSYVWDRKPLNSACPTETQFFINRTAFVNTVGENQIPLFLGEFGINQQNVTVREDHFLSCFLAYATDQDLDWGFWGLQGSYYFRENKTNPEETFGVLDFNWNRIRNPLVQNRLEIIKRKNQDPTAKSSTSYIIFHPQSGTCVISDGKEGINAAKCKEMSQWNYNGDGGPMKLKGSDLCLKAVGDGHAPVLTKNCSTHQSYWTRLSESKLLLGAQDENGDYLCLHMNSPHTSMILTKKCICVQGDDPNCQKDPQNDPTNQWFKLVETNVS